jgi:hypothetical protein
MTVTLDRVQIEADGSTSVILVDNNKVLDPNNPAWPAIILNIPAGTNVHTAYQQAIAFCAQNGVRVIPQFILLNPSGTTGTVLS